MVNQSNRVPRTAPGVDRPQPATVADRSLPPAPSNESDLRWFTMDLHLHTPASIDYQEPSVSYLDILRRTDERGLDIVAFTDHNSVRGYAEVWREIEDLELLEYLGRLNEEEATRLAEYRSLLDRILLLPGFEFTATFGFHILAVFPEQTSIRMMEHLLLLLGVSEQKFGSGEVGSTTDVLRAYEILNSHGALVIGAHVNSANGIAMQGMRFGGQTKIAYTQDPNLHALEVTDLAVQGSRRTTAAFFNGTKSEYPRRMHAIQGSDAHRLLRDPDRPSNLGVGDRATDVRLPEISFSALKALFLGEQFDRTRPHINRDDPFEIVRAARVDGNTETQAFHESLSNKRTGAANVMRDVVAFANGDGGTVFIGASPSERRPVAGVSDPKSTAAQLLSEIEKTVTPRPDITVQTLPVGGKHVVAAQVPSGADKPYAHAPGGIFVRRGDESLPASRDEIVAMVRGVSPRPVAPAPPVVVPEPPVAPIPQERRPAAAPTATPQPIPETAAIPIEPSETIERRRRRRGGEQPRARPRPSTEGTVTVPPVADISPAPVRSEPESTAEYVEEAEPDGIAPRIGVEIVDERVVNGETLFTLRDLRNGNLTHNVPPTTKGRLWRYAIQEHQHRPVDTSKVRWRGDYGYVRAYRPRGEKTRHNLVLRQDGNLRVFYGVTEDGMSETWKAVMPSKTD